MSWFSRKKPAASQATPAADPPAPAPTAPASRSIMARMNEHLLNQVSAPSSDSTAALNSQIVQAVQFTIRRTLPMRRRRSRCRPT